jgi:hypothetical protein
MLPFKVLRRIDRWLRREEASTLSLGIIFMSSTFSTLVSSQLCVGGISVKL